jgi:hypothetical protein
MDTTYKIVINNSIQLFILCAASTAERPITDTAQQI